MSSPDSQARTAWLMLFVSSILWIPVLITLPLALYWQSEARGTVYASHLRAIVRYCWIVLALPLALLVIPSMTVALIVALLVMFVFAYAALDGMRSVAQGNRYKGIFT